MSRVVPRSRGRPSRSRPGSSGSCTPCGCSRRPSRWSRCTWDTPADSGGGGGRRTDGQLTGTWDTHSHIRRGPDAPRALTPSPRCYDPVSCRHPEATSCRLRRAVLTPPAPRLHRQTPRVGPSLHDRQRTAPLHRFTQGGASVAEGRLLAEEPSLWSA